MKTTVFASRRLGVSRQLKRVLYRHADERSVALVRTLVRTFALPPEAETLMLSLVKRIPDRASRLALFILGQRSGLDAARDNKPLFALQSQPLVARSNDHDPRQVCSSPTAPRGDAKREERPAPLTPPTGPTSQRAKLPITVPTGAWRDAVLHYAAFGLPFSVACSCAYEELAAAPPLPRPFLARIAPPPPSFTYHPELVGGDDSSLTEQPTLFLSQDDEEEGDATVQEPALVRMIHTLRGQGRQRIG